MSELPSFGEFGARGVFDLEDEGDDAHESERLLLDAGELKLRCVRMLRDVPALAMRCGVGDFLEDLAGE